MNMKVASTDELGIDHGNASRATREPKGRGTSLSSPLIALPLAIAATVLTCRTYDLSYLWALPLYATYGSVIMLVISGYRYLCRKP